MLKAKKRDAREPQNGAIISIIGPGMEVAGDLTSDGTVRVEGRVTGAVKARKSVVVGKDGVVDGDITTQDAVVAGRVTGTLVAASRVEVQATARIDGEVLTRRLKLEEGARMNGRVEMQDDLELEPEPESHVRTDAGSRVMDAAEVHEQQPAGVGSAT